MKQLFADGISFLILLVVFGWPAFVILELVITPGLPIWALWPIGIVSLLSLRMLSNAVRRHRLRRSISMGNVQGIWSDNLVKNTTESSSIPVIIIHVLDPII